MSRTRRDCCSLPGDRVASETTCRAHTSTGTGVLMLKDSLTAEEIDAGAEADSTRDAAPARDSDVQAVRPGDPTLLLRVIVIAIIVGALYVGQDVLIPITL